MSGSGNVEMSAFLHDNSMYRAMEADMNMNGTITMAMRELDRLKVIQAVIDGTVKPGRAAERLGLTDRQVRRLVSSVRTEGPPGIVS